MTPLPLQEDGMMSHYVLAPGTGYLLGESRPLKAMETPVLLGWFLYLDRSWDRLVLEYVDNQPTSSSYSVVGRVCGTLNT